MTRQQARDRIRRLFGLEPTTPFGSRAGREMRRRARSERDACAWKKREAEEKEQRGAERLFESERFRAQLERRGVLFPGSD